MTHAWLFTGPPGSGRSNAARAFAAALQCPRGGCGECDACHTVLAGTHADVEVVNTSTLSIGGQDVAGPGHAGRAPPSRWAVAGDDHRGRRPAHRPGGERPAQGDRGADAAHRVAAVRARRSRTSCRPSAPGAGTWRCARRRPRRSPRCWSAVTASTRRWPRSPRAPRRATSAGPSGWPRTRTPGCAGTPCCGCRCRWALSLRRTRGGRRPDRGRHCGGQRRRPLISTRWRSRT